MSNNRNITTANLVWRGRNIQINYEPGWLSWDSSPQAPFSHAHLEVRTLAPERGALPITETGYRSHFTNRHLVERAGGPVAYVLTWLESAAAVKWWQESEAASRQLSLF